MQNKLIDLNNHLFAQAERLCDEGISDNSLINEVERSRALAGLAKEIVNNAKLAFDAHQALRDCIEEKPPEMFGIGVQK